MFPKPFQINKPEQSSVASRRMSQLSLSNLAYPLSLFDNSIACIFFVCKVHEEFTATVSLPALTIHPHQRRQSSADQRMKKKKTIIYVPINTKGYSDERRVEERDKTMKQYYND